VLDLAQRCDVIEKTGWSLEYLDQCPLGVVSDMAAYWSMKDAYRQSEGQ